MNNSNYIMLCCLLSLGMIILSYYIDGSIEPKEMASKTYIAL